MRWRLVAVVSLCVNMVLMAAWLIGSRHNATKNGKTGDGRSGTETGESRTNYLVRRLPFSWRQIESPDYPTYIANLRDIGCPEQTIRDIIIADVNGLFARRRATELVTFEQQWWRSEPDPQIVQAAAEKSRALEEERRGLLTRLLGISWESGDLVSIPRPSRAAIVLDGPVLGSLPVELKQAIQDVNLHSQERLQEYVDSQRQEGVEPDPAVLAKLRQQTRDDLARLLSPPQLEEFLLRYSQNANDLRVFFGQLRYFNPSQAEFREVFRASDALDQRIQSMAGSEDPNVVAQRKALEDQRENAIKIALGPKRYEEFRLLQDPTYRDAVAAAEAAGTPEAARTIYAVNLAALAEQQRISADSSLTSQQKDVELKKLELQRTQAATLASGQDLPPEPPSIPAPPTPRKVYVLGPGDSAATIALMYGLPVSAILAANPKVNFNKLKPGQAITIPPSPLAPGSAP